MVNRLIIIGKGFLISALLVYLLFNIKDKPAFIELEIKAEFLQDDHLQVFYKYLGQEKFTEKQSTRITFEGKQGIRKFRLKLPVIKSLQELRLDLGQNKNQKEINIRSIDLISLGTRAKLNLTDSYFNSNEFIDIQGDRVYLKPLNNLYDPFLTSNNEVSKQLINLRVPQPIIEKKFIYLIGCIFFISITTFLFSLNTIFYFKQTIENVFLIFFFTSIFLPTLLLNLKSDKNEIEKRKMASKPEFTFNQNYPALFEDYFNDNFGFRNNLIELSALIKVKIFKSSPKPEEALFGKDGYLFYNSLKGSMYSSYANKNLYTKKEIEEKYQELLKRKVFLNDQGIIYVCGFWPNKHSIYSEKLPFSMKMQIRNELNLRTQITSYLKQKNFHFFDVTQDLMKSKLQYNLYRKFDTHWNSHGAFVGYKSFFNINYALLGVKPFDYEDFKISNIKHDFGDLANIMGVEKMSYTDDFPVFEFKKGLNYFNETNNFNFDIETKITKNPNCGNELRVLIFGDSFSRALVQFISLHYSEVIYLNSSYQQTMIQEYSPNIVITTKVERDIKFL
ncbi:alginate O-acetyltransferase AlgX-related protein [Croceitalea vernalis]|uniref:AlgX/AlgJ SGNH hydrolase-like domain-containing protein n=1 Tax=Croceitalea vernalis TaxID=3075599 RepID=A0ABU3BJ10_9FLAO|nr:hypothetical protein [Croceitalea sp. P007]MDT0622105.1 hypothetical protein [Croceitalea sp. P007]